jgi:hypothetical protein
MKIHPYVRRYTRTDSCFFGTNNKMAATVLLLVLASGDFADGTIIKICFVSHAVYMSYSICLSTSTWIGNVQAVR